VLEVPAVVREKVLAVGQAPGSTPGDPGAFIAQTREDGGMTAAETLLDRLEAIGLSLSRRPDVVALLAVGSVGRDRELIDEHSDLDFFVIVDDDAKQRYLDDIDWLRDAAPVVYDFRNTVDGRKILFGDGIYGEYAVFTRAEVEAASFAPGRVVWQRADAPSGLDMLGRLPPRPAETPEFLLNEALTNLYVGLHRDARGEHLSGMRLIQVHAIDRLLDYLELAGGASDLRDPFAVERRAEARLAEADFPFAEMLQGYERNRQSALAILGWIERRARAAPALASRIRTLAER
jgi:hypothetical protein